jgi:hypothetical protein
MVALLANTADIGVVGLALVIKRPEYTPRACTPTVRDKSSDTTKPSSLDNKLEASSHNSGERRCCQIRCNKAFTRLFRSQRKLRIRINRA